MSDQLPIYLVDLQAQQARIRDRIDRAVKRVLDHGQYVMGPEVPELERRLTAFCGASYGLTCANGTDALLIAMMALNAGPGDAILCPAFTFPATPEAIALLGATPIFVDVDLSTHNLAPEGLSAGLEAARINRLRPAGIIAVDLFGLPADYSRLEAFAEAEEMWLLADAAQSFGASQAGQKVGTFATATTTSFFPAKPLGCYGDGGAIFTNDPLLYETMDSIRLHGRSGQGGKYSIERIGVNSRLDTIQAAILLEKLEIFSDEIRMRDAVAQRYNKGLAGIVETPVLPKGSHSVWAQYTIHVPLGSRNRLVQKLASAGVPTAVYYPRPLHHQKAYNGFPIAPGGLPTSERLAEEVLSLPMHPYLLPPQQERIIESVCKAIKEISL